MNNHSLFCIYVSLKYGFNKRQAPKHTCSRRLMESCSTAFSNCASSRLLCGIPCLGLRSGAKLHKTASQCCAQKRTKNKIQRLLKEPLPRHYSLLHSVLGVQIHTMSDIFHGPKFKEQPQVQNHQNEKSERQNNFTFISTLSICLVHNSK